MDNLTKGFVIAACGVIIATPIVLLGKQGLEAKRKQDAARTALCRDEAQGRYPLSLRADTDLILEQLDLQFAFIRRCTDSTKPVWKVKS